MSAPGASSALLVADDRRACEESRSAFRPELFVNHYGSSEVYTCTIDQARRQAGPAGAPAQPDDRVVD